MICPVNGDECAVKVCRTGCYYDKTREQVESERDATIKELRELLVGSERMLRNNAAVLKSDMHNHDATFTEELADKIQAALKEDS